MGSHYKGTTAVEELRREALLDNRRTVAEARQRLVLPLSAIDDRAGASVITCARCCAVDLYRPPKIRPANILCRNCGFAETPFPEIQQDGGPRL
jgi:hypothetical protein